MPGKVTDTGSTTEYMTLAVLCHELSISYATGKNWVRLSKLIPDRYRGKTPLFSKTNINNIKKELLSNKNKALKSRRNKAFISGNNIYKSYIDNTSGNMNLVHSLLKQIDAHSVRMSEALLKLILCDCAIKLILQRLQNIFNVKHALLSYLEDSSILGIYQSLVDTLSVSKETAYDLYEKHPYLFENAYTYQNGEDLLGLLYLSLKSMKSRKATGSYYTPTHIVKKVIGQLIEDGQLLPDQTILDPCCGTGNFLIQLPDTIDYAQIYGSDIDKTSVLLTRINVALHFTVQDINILYQHITPSNYLTGTNKKRYDIILGNPPWGYRFSDKEKKKLKDKFACAVGKNIESFDLFVEQSLCHLTTHGRLSFVLPEAILTVKAHLPIRSYMLKHSTIRRIDYLGERFDKVQCPSIILHTEAVEDAFSCIGMKITSPESSFLLTKERLVTPASFSFLISDEEYKILEKMRGLTHVTCLKDQADFALGIVSGDNLSVLSEQKQDGYEPILKGCDIQKYHITEPDRFIRFVPSQYQQTAPEHFYRVSEKLLYRFISDQLVFAYDNRQHVTLNSCNILIPHIEGLHMKYILAILNSSIAQFYFHKEFHSVKVLRSHIEQIPIPYPSDAQQQKVIVLVDFLLTTKNDDSFQQTYQQLDQIIASLYELTESQYVTIKNSVLHS